jgi:hypothetical protein
MTLDANSPIQSRQSLQDVRAEVREVMGSLETAAADATQVATHEVEHMLVLRNLPTTPATAVKATNFPDTKAGDPPSMAVYAPKVGSYGVSDNSMVFDIDALTISKVSASKDRVAFTVSTTVDLPWPKKDVSKTTTIDVQRTAGSSKVYVDMGSQGGFNGTVAFAKDGTMTITPNRDQGTGGVDSIAIARGGQPITIKIEAPVGSAYRISASPD